MSCDTSIYLPEKLLSATVRSVNITQRLASFFRNGMAAQIGDGFRAKNITHTHFRTFHTASLNKICFPYVLTDQRQSKSLKPFIQVTWCLTQFN